MHPPAPAFYVSNDDAGRRDGVLPQTDERKDSKDFPWLCGRCHDCRVRLEPTDSCNRRSAGSRQIGWIPAAGGFLLGIGFLLLLDYLIPHLHIGSKDAEGPNTSMKRIATGDGGPALPHPGRHGGRPRVRAGRATRQTLLPRLLRQSRSRWASAYRTFPKAAISLPLRQEGMSVNKSFVSGMLQRYCGADLWHP